MLKPHSSLLALASIALLSSGCALSYQASEYDRQAFVEMKAQHSDPIMAREASRIFGSASYQTALQGRGPKESKNTFSKTGLLWIATDPAQPKATEKYVGYLSRSYIAESGDTLVSFYDIQGSFVGMLNAESQLLVLDDSGQIVSQGTSTINDAAKRLFGARHFHANDSFQYVETTLLRKLPNWDSEGADVRGVTVNSQEAYLKRLDLDAAGAVTRLDEIEKDKFDQRVAAKSEALRLARRGPLTDVEKREATPPSGE